MSNKKIVIIGAGLSGLYLAYRLKDSGFQVSIVEGRDRLGGRILTTNKNNEAPVELGATWFGAKHKRLIRILSELNMDSFEQALGQTAFYEPISTSPPQLVQLPLNDDPSFRIAGGTSSLINRLADQLPADQISLNESVLSIDFSKDSVEIKTSKTTHQADIVVSTLPPYLLQGKISFMPSLPEKFRQVAKATHTWMGESIKVALVFKAPIWKKPGLSATIFSNVGPISEMYEHNDFENKHFALKGFLNGAYHIASKEQRLAKVIEQLKKYFGKAIEQYISYEELVWNKEAFTFLPYEQPMLPHQNNGHPIFREKLYAGRLLLAGAETAAQFPGYMDGALGSADHVYEQLLN